MPLLAEQPIDDYIKEVKLEQRIWKPEGEDKEIEYNVIALYLENGETIDLSLKSYNKMKLDYCIKTTDLKK